MERQGNCQVHPDIPLTFSQSTIKTKRGWKLVRVETCEKCDELLDFLRKTKVTTERHLK